MIAGSLLAGVAGFLCAHRPLAADAARCCAASPASARPPLFVGAATLVADLAPPERRAEAASYFSVAVFGGLGIGPIIGEAVLRRRPLPPGVPRRRQLRRARRRAVAGRAPTTCRPRSTTPTSTPLPDAPRLRQRIMHPAARRPRPRAGVRHRRVLGVLGVPARVRPRRSGSPAPAACSPPTASSACCCASSAPAASSGSASAAPSRSRSSSLAVALGGARACSRTRGRCGRRRSSSASRRRSCTRR